MQSCELACALRSGSEGFVPWRLAIPLPARTYSPTRGASVDLMLKGIYWAPMGLVVSTRATTALGGAASEQLFSR